MSAVPRQPAPALTADQIEIGQRATAVLGQNPTVADVAARRRRLCDIASSTDDPAVRHELASLAYLAYDFDAAGREAQAAFAGFRAAGDRRRAALSAALLARIYFEGLDNEPAARGWFARARTMLEGEGQCVERGWVLLGLVGCSIADPSELASHAGEALAIARAHGDPDLESKALADGGLAAISRGDARTGVAMLDEAMAMVSTGEVGFFTAAQVFCDTVTACERSGDLGRLEAWLDVIDRDGVERPDEQRPAVFSHCHASYGTILCRVGRWTEAESALRLALATSRAGFGYHRVGSRAALAELRVRQGRLEEARSLLRQCGDRVEASFARARLLFAEGRHVECIDTLGRALRQHGPEDRTRAIPLLALLVDAALATRDVEAARLALTDLERRTEGPAGASFRAYGALARGRFLLAVGDQAGAAAAIEDGLATASGDRLPLLAADLYLALAELPDRASELVSTDALAAFELYDGIGAPEAARCAAILGRLGHPVSARQRPASPLDSLSPRELEALHLLGAGMSNPEIAERMFVTRKTAEHHVSAILRKLGLRNRAEAAAYATSQGQ